MNFIDAHKMVHRLAGAVTNSRNAFVSDAIIPESKTLLYDAFYIFLGHTILYHTRTDEEISQYIILSRSISFIISSRLYNTFVESQEIIEKSKNNTLFRLGNKQKIDIAKSNERMSVELFAQCNKEYMNRVYSIDYGAFLNECCDFIRKTYNPNAGENRFFMLLDQYIPFVYSYTSQKAPIDSDYSVFWTWDDMRDWFNHFNDLAEIAKPIYSMNREYILNNK